MLFYIRFWVTNHRRFVILFRRPKVHLYSLIDPHNFARLHCSNSALIRRQTSCAMVAILSKTLLFRSSQRRRAVRMMRAFASRLLLFGAILLTCGHHKGQVERGSGVNCCKPSIDRISNQTCRENGHCRVRWFTVSGS